VTQTQARELAAYVAGIATTRDALAGRFESTHEWVVELPSGHILTRPLPADPKEYKR